MKTKAKPVNLVSQGYEIKTLPITNHKQPPRLEALANSNALPLLSSFLHRSPFGEALLTIAGLVLLDSNDFCSSKLLNFLICLTLSFKKLPRGRTQDTVKFLFQY